MTTRATATTAATTTPEPLAEKERCAEVSKGEVPKDEESIVAARKSATEDEEKSQGTVVVSETETTQR